MSRPHQTEGSMSETVVYSVPDDSGDTPTGTVYYSTKASALRAAGQAAQAAADVSGRAETVVVTKHAVARQRPRDLAVKLLNHARWEANREMVALVTRRPRADR